MTGARLRWAIGVLALIGTAIAAYLTYARYADESLFCLAGSSACETVQRSRYAELAGAPVAVLGLGAYLAILVTALLPGRSAAAAGAVIALAGVLFSGWLLYAQVALIDALCQWCLASDVVVSLTAAAALVRLRIST
jgi:uncharacterized membrane protein